MNLPKPIKFEVERYVGGLSQFKKINNPIKLSANESAIGASPKAIEAFEKEKNKVFKYPEDDSNSLRVRSDPSESLSSTTARIITTR